MNNDFENYKDFLAVDFSLDENFIASQKNPTKKSEIFWKSFLQQYPGKKTALDQAGKIVERLQFDKYTPAEKLKDKLWEQVIIKKRSAVVVHINRFKWMAAAAILILMLTTATFFYFNQSSKNQIAKKDVPGRLKNDVEPGSNKAVLTLADGSTIILDTAKKGTLSQQGNTKILKLDDGQLAYSSGGANEEVVYNTVSTPRGGQYQITLADGSKVWLNASSSLKFPAAFSGKKRNVELTGEGYFEVVHDASKPFYVKVNDMEVEVLGTHFNVNAYTDEAAIKVTLLEGGVKINKGSLTSLLKPKQQAQILNGIKIIDNVNLDETVAWKDGYFHFESADLKTILRQFARWYDIEVVYEGPVSSEKYFSIMNRNSSLSNVLKSLQANGIKFKIDNQKLYIE